MGATEYQTFFHNLISLQVKTTFPDDVFHIFVINLHSKSAALPTVCAFQTFKLKICLVNGTGMQCLLQKYQKYINMYAYMNKSNILKV